MSTAVLERTHNPVSDTQSTPLQPARPDMALTQIMLGSLNAQALYVAAKLGVADALAGGSKSIQDLAKEVGADESSLYRILRALCSLGVFGEQSGRIFHLTPAGHLLRSDVAGSLRDMAIFMGEDWHWNV